MPQHKQSLKTDVLVAGGGCAGLTAALAAARQGCDVILVERAPFAGGVVTAVGLPYLDGLVDPDSGAIVTRGIPVEILSRMGGCAPDAQRAADISPRLREEHSPAAVLIPSTEQFKRVADAMLAECAPRLRILYSGMVCDASVRENRITRVSVAAKTGLYPIEARTYIDATGDADLAWLAECAVEKSTPLMPMTLHFRIGNVHPHPRMKAQMQTVCERAAQAGELQAFYGPYFECHYAHDEIDVHAIRINGDASDAFDLSRAEMEGRRDSWLMFERWKKDVPGFEDAYFVTSGPFIGVRETRRLHGRYRLHEDDILGHTVFDDAVATGTWYMDVHPNSATPGDFQDYKPYWPGPYQIPYRSLLPVEINNLVVAGRCHSATRQAAASSRVTATAMAMGQAAGHAAALAQSRRQDVGDLHGEAVGNALAENGAGIYIPERRPAGTR